MNRNKSRSVTARDVELGQPLSQSVYSITHTLLMRRGNVITTEHQKQYMLEHGFIDIIDKSAAMQAEPEHTRAGSNTIFDIKNLWVSELYLLLIKRRNIKSKDFTHRILQIALQIQWQAQTNHDALLASLQLDQDSHYGLIHALHVAVCCEMLGKGIYMGQLQRLPIVAAALTHDIGIVVEQEDINMQSGNLTSQQWDNIKQHPVTSADMLLQMGVDDHMWLSTVRHHHERLDGSGYPEKLRGAQIGQSSRIIAIADIYSAMVHTKAFKAETGGKSALSELYRLRDVGLDSVLVETFIAEVGVYPPGSLVKLANNEVAVVFSVGSEKQSPMVYALIAAEGRLYVRPQLRDTSEKAFKIVAEQMLRDHRVLLTTIEKLWCQD